jgi:hypothetical protein
MEGIPFLMLTAGHASLNIGYAYPLCLLSPFVFCPVVLPLRPPVPLAQGLSIHHLWSASTALALLGGSTLSVRVGGAVTTGDEAGSSTGIVVALDGSLAESTVPPNAVEQCSFWESIAYASEVRGQSDW